ncbi:hypothetical protein HOA91_02710 [Candidatus Woesearchaeota archaeon]|jgi:hypothetical protein|nr:hypothetical protein [Candidatus Woesearchaeota archaeon]
MTTPTPLLNNNQNQSVAIDCRDLAMKMALKKGTPNEKRQWLKLTLYACQTINSIHNSMDQQKVTAQLEVIKLAIGKNI